MKTVIESKALEANLKQTKIAEVIIPEEHRWLISLSEQFWGIHKRMVDFFNEYHHPYSNREEIVNSLVNLTISDFWIFKNHPERTKAVKLILEIFDKLLNESLSDSVSKQLVFVYLDFINHNYDSLAESDDLLNYYFQILNDNFERNKFSYLGNMASFKKCLQNANKNPKSTQLTFDFMKILVTENIKYWDNCTKLDEWYLSHESKMSKDYSSDLKSLGKEFFDEYYQLLNKADNWKDINKLAFTFSDIIDAYRKKIDIFEKTTEQFLYIFYLLHLEGVAYYRDYLLLDLNKAIKRISSELNELQSIQSIDELFILFEDFKSSHINLILDSILNLGKEIINTNNILLIEHFENKIIEFGFITPGMTYLTNDWQLKVNPNHIKNIRVWMELIEYNPEIMRKLLSALIINLRLGGIFIFDTDLFQKDITKLLNSEISPIYKQIKQLTRIFPVYFNEIGAEGVLRDVSTIIDEISHRNDKLIHFLRKQIHTEGNNSHIDIILQIIGFWESLDKERLINIVPQNVYESVDVESYWVRGVHKVIVNACNHCKCTLHHLLEMNKDELALIMKHIEFDHPNDPKRVSLIIELYQLLKEKYLFEAVDITDILKKYTFIDKFDIEDLEVALSANDKISALRIIFNLMVILNEIIFDNKQSEGWESIYYKRHIAFGIPSMYGQYREPKFEALGLTFRLESFASVIIDDIISGINTEYFTAKTLKKVYNVAKLLSEGLRLDGIYNQGFISNLNMLQYSLSSGTFTIRQYINIFQFMERSIKEIINNYFIQPYEQLLVRIIPRHMNEEEKNDGEGLKKIIARKSEMFYRELLSSAFLIQSLDNFIGKILVNLKKLIEDLNESEIQKIMNYNPDMVISPIYEETTPIDNQVFLGSKAYYLKKLALNNFPVPNGFVITTEVFRRLNTIVKLPSLESEIDNLILNSLAKLEEESGRKYGDNIRPLLLSVRSGSTISMPGAMNTFLNVGLNDEITERLSQEYNWGWTSWDCYRRLLQTWGMSHELDRNDFDQIMIDYKKKHGISKKIEFSPQIMREIAFSYKQLLIDNDIEFEENPWKQLKKAIFSVFNSWDTSRAKVYREHLKIADEWGTAVIVQRMVFGNLHRESGSGVLFTHDPQDNVPGINLGGDFSFLSQGEDIVAGLISTLPISEHQRQKFHNQAPFSLENAFPDIFNKLKEISVELIEKHGFGHQEIEFTFETSNPEDLFVLQTRNLSIPKQSHIEIFDDPEKKMKNCGCGIGIGNSVMNGVVVFDMDDINQLNKIAPGEKAILVRPDTVPDDIEMIFICEGLLTSKGGAASHAAVTAASLGKTCVVNCNEMMVFENDKRCIMNGIEFRAFDKIAIDGRNGLIFRGNYPIRIQEI
ncbi:MAG: hypothetical protein A2X64_00250 [Ignavibacteria bacterium GWF2_33_9]|nr:MAG: hypothetical protein A2X64_00250 [Ignavibacteria bacterium GWF2_33_9]